MKTLLCLLAAVLVAAPALAEIPAEETFPALGAPAHPKVEVSWNRFHDHAGLTTILRQLHAAYPDLTNLVKIGETFDGREMWVLEVTAKNVGDPATKPAMWIDGNIHGNEVQAGDTVAYTAWYLCEMYDEVPRVKQLLDERAFYLLPSVNPDGRDNWFHAPNNPHSSRTGHVPVDNDQDGRFDEDDVDDLDGDGSITRMRIKDPWGRYEADPDFPDDVLNEVPLDERGGYTYLGWEGIDNDNDGEINEDGLGGYDTNRNWAWQWAPEATQYGAMDYPFSLPESRNIANYVLSKPNIAAAQCYHNAGGMILRGPGQDVGKVNPADERVTKYIGDKGERMLPYYKSWIVWKDLYTVWGGEFEWFYGARGILSFTNELWTNDNLFREPLERGDEGDKGRAWFLRHMLQGQGLTPWAEYDHPQYGKIEIGGTWKNFGRVPPSFLLEEELHRNMMFTLYHAESMPLVKLGEVTVTDLGGGLRRVRVGIENHGVIPTRTGQDRDHAITPKNTVTLEGVKVVAGGLATDPRMDKVEWQKVRPQRVLLDSLEGLRLTTVDFLVEGTGSATVTVTADRGGTVSRKVDVR